MGEKLNKSDIVDMCTTFYRQRTQGTQGPQRAQLMATNAIKDGHSTFFNI